MKPVTQDGRSARWDAHRRERRKMLLRTVRHAVADHGPEISMEQLSVQAQTTKTVLYRYFGDRGGLQRAMGEWAMKVITRSLDRADYSPHTPRESLRAMISAFVDLAARAPNVYRFCDAAVTSTADPKADNDYDTFFQGITALLCRRLQLSGDAEVQWAYGAIGFVRASTERWLLRPTDQEAFVDQLTTWLWSSRSTALTGIAERSQTASSASARTTPPAPNSETKE
ncbi:TetR/AcrR family transcriptional regulator [Brevibacterium luteolum]|uniref:TetR/AcrR family transcriptional regulator n=1 Tax=Brevibacterium luteolum TaxID=199591 RepID=UPI003879CABF